MNRPTLQPYPADASVTGDLRVLPGVHSPQLDRDTDLLIWLPPDYAGGDRRYPVVYLHDGQNLFDRRTGFGGLEWRADETMTALHREGLDAVLVGIPNAGSERMEDYTRYTDPEHGGGGAEDYLAFVAETVKPLVDEVVRTQPEREHTSTVGSSLGALVSLSCFLLRSEVFGGAGLLSPSFWWPGDRLLEDLRAGIPAGRVYLDVGGQERDDARGSEAYVQDVRRVAEFFDAAPETLLRLEFDPDGHHGERWWAERLPDALRFLLGS